MLNQEQLEVVAERDKNVLVSASPGSGKTRTLVSRAKVSIDDLPKFKSIALITYTNAAADEISSRLESHNKVFVGTIHSFCLEYILRPFGWKYNWTRPRVISFEEQEVFFEQHPEIDLETNAQSKFDELNKVKKTLDGTLDINENWPHEKSIQTVAEAYYRYQSEIGVIDFNEILYRSYKIISELPFVACSLDAMFFEILVDEFQDTNLFQYEILREIFRYKTCKFVFVGDAKQQIFSFAGAIPGAFGRAFEDFEAKKVELVKTYRSTDNIVNAYSRLFTNHPEIQNLSEWRSEDAKVWFKETRSANHIQTVQQIVKRLIDEVGASPESIAILSTSWWSAFPVSRALRQDFNVVGLGALPHKIAMNSSVGLLRALAKHSLQPTISNLRAVRRNIDVHLLEHGLIYSDKVLETKINGLVSGFLKMDKNIPLSIGLHSTRTLFDRQFDINHSLIDDLFNSIDEEESNAWSLERYLQVLSGVGGITCNTIHKVKGLEFDVVILNEMNENRIPYQRLLDRTTWTYEDLPEERIEEGRKLFYVALSRGRKLVIVLHNWKPSMFLDIIRS